MISDHITILTSEYDFDALRLNWFRLEAFMSNKESGMGMNGMDTHLARFTKVSAEF